MTKENKVNELKGIREIVRSFEGSIKGTNIAEDSRILHDSPEFEITRNRTDYSDQGVRDRELLDRYGISQITPEGLDRLAEEGTISEKEAEQAKKILEIFGLTRKSRGKGGYKVVYGYAQKSIYHYLFPDRKIDQKNPTSKTVGENITKGLELYRSVRNAVFPQAATEGGELHTTQTGDHLQLFFWETMNFVDTIMRNPELNVSDYYYSMYIKPLYDYHSEVYRLSKDAEGTPRHNKAKEIAKKRLEKKIELLTKSGAKQKFINKNKVLLRMLEIDKIGPATANLLALPIFARYFIIRKTDVFKAWFDGDTTISTQDKINFYGIVQSLIAVDANKYRTKDWMHLLGKNA